MTISWSPMRAGLTALLLACAPQWAVGSKIYRCGPDGREYSQVPCKDGQLVDAADPRSEAQRRAAAAATQREEQSTEKMTRERQARERAASKKVAINVGPAKPPAPPASAAKGKPVKAKPAARAASASAAAQR